MPKNKKAAPIAILGEESDLTVEQLASELNGVSAGWRPSHIISGETLVYVRDTIDKINTLLNPKAEEEESTEPEA